jgi:hypothetical protein
MNTEPVVIVKRNLLKKRVDAGMVIGIADIAFLPSGENATPDGCRNLGKLKNSDMDTIKNE